MVLCDFALGAPGSPVNKPISQIDAIDFRLLRVFDTVFDQRSLTRAALQLEISQPAVSQALGRLRRRFGDPLFVRSADGLAPTPRAEGLAAPVRAILAVYRDQLVASATFDASSAEREFAFYITDLGALLLMPTLMARFARVAPRVKLRTVSIDSSTIVGGLESGKVDLAIGPFPRMPDGIFRQRLFEDDIVCLVRQRHPLLRRGFDATSYRAAEHVLVTTAGTGHAFNPQVETAIAAQVPAERIRVRVHNFTVAAMLLVGTDMILTLPRRAGVLLATRLGLKLAAAPVAFRKLEIHQYWHERFQHDAGHRWFRAVVGELFNEKRARPS